MVDSQEALTRLVGVVARFLKLRVRRMGGEKIVRSFEEVAEQVRRRGGVPGGITGKGLPNVNSKVFPCLAQVAAHSSP
jgi:hypothetical protein